MGYRNTEQQREYQKNWIKKRRGEWITANGPCRKCGSWLELEVDHIDPTTKLFQPAAIWSRKKEVRDAELAKCQVLCFDCHLKKTQQTYPERIHGTSTMYRCGFCRCRACKAAHATRARLRKLGFTEKFLCA